MTAIKIERRQDPAAVDRILHSLPDWFGIEEAIGNYVESASRRDSFLAVMDGEVIGVALVDRHFPESAELTLIAVQAGRRGAGIGAAQRRLDDSHRGGAQTTSGAHRRPIIRGCLLRPDQGLLWSDSIPAPARV